MIDLQYLYKEMLLDFENAAPFRPDLSIILGSGLGSFPKSVEIIETIPTAQLKGYPAGLVEGHANTIYFANHAGKKLLLFSGRVHPYEGHPIDQCILPVLLAAHLRSPRLLITNAAGAINPHFRPGDLVLLSSLNGLAIKPKLHQLMRLASLEQRNSFLQFPSEGLGEIMREAAAYSGVPLREGVYYYASGPSYETPAEIRMMRTIGSDLVGMSTYHEAVYAFARGIETVIVSCVTNYAAGLSGEKLSHDDVRITADKIKHTFARLVNRFIEGL